MSGGEKKFDPGLIILTSNADSGGAFDGTLKMDPGLAKRFSDVILFPKLPDEVITQLAGREAARQLGDKDMTKDEQHALGQAVMGMIGPADAEKGARRLKEQIRELLAQPIAGENDERLAAHSPAYAARTGDRRSERLAEAFRRNVHVKPMKTLRLVTQPQKAKP